MKIIHISDTHIGSEKIASMNAERMNMFVDDLLRHRLADPKKDVILHTGDLINSATGQNRYDAKKILDRLDHEGYRVILCPGNHDYGNNIAMEATKAKIFKTEFAPYIFHGARQEFPVLIPFDDHVFIGLDSNADELNCWQRFFAEGHLGQKQLEKLNDMLDSDSVRGRKIILYMHHHPFYYGYSVKPDICDKNPLPHLLAGFTRSFRRLKDAYSLCQIIRNRIDVLCFGHMHHGLDCSGESSKYGIKLALDGGSITCADNNSDRMRYRIIDLESMTHEVRMIRMPRLSP